MTSATVAELTLRPLTAEAPVRENKMSHKVMSKNMQNKTKKDLSVYTTG